MIEQHPVRPPGTGKMILGGVWGFVDAAILFIGPEIWISWRAMRSGTYQGLVLALPVAAGAVVGALALYFVAIEFPAETRNLLRLSPDIDIVTFARANEAMREIDALAIFAGTFELVPIKIFAVEADSARVHPGFLGLAFLFIYLARGMFFAMLGGLAGIFLSKRPWQRVLPGFLLVWAVAYAGYFAIRLL